MHPRDKVDKVALSIEFDAGDLFKHKPNFRWAVDRSLSSGNLHIFCVSIDMPTDKFKSMLGGMSASDCNQDFISHLKYAREVGAAWVVFRLQER